MMHKDTFNKYMKRFNSTNREPRCRKCGGNDFTKYLRGINLLDNTKVFQVHCNNCGDMLIVEVKQ